MSFSENFSYSQTLGLPSKINLIDTSTGSNVAITSRRVYLAKFDGSFLVPSGTSTEYIVWSYSSSTITIDALNKDYALIITVDWLDINGTVLYSKSQLAGLSLFGVQFDYQLTQNISGNAILLSDNNFWDEKNILQTSIESGDEAILVFSDQQGAQQCYDIATDIRNNSQYVFNMNS